MKKIVLFLFAIAVFSPASAQLVKFKAANYYVGDEVRADIISRTQVTVENDLTKQSEIKPAGSNILLGTISAPGIYKLTFLFSATLKETYYILAGFKTDDVTNGSSKKVNTSTTASSMLDDVFIKLAEKYASLRWKIIAKQSFEEYISTHAVSGTITLTLCFSSGAVPAFVPVCVGGFKSEFKDLTVIVVKKTAEEMAAQNIITQDQKNKFIAAIEGVSNAVDFFSAKGKLGKVITAGAIAADYALDDKTLKLLVQQQKQLYDQTKILISVGKQ